jgi:DNA-binding NtrC family response regulator
LTALFSLESKIISILDDKPDITGLFRVALQTTAGGRIYAFTEPTLALEHIKNNKSDYALVISDFNMPNLNGIKLINNIKLVNPFIRTILMTGFEINDKLFQDLTKREIIMDFFKNQLK